MTRDQYIALFEQGLENTLFRGLTRDSVRAGAAALVDTLASVGVLKIDSKPVEPECCVPPKEHDKILYHWLIKDGGHTMIAKWEKGPLSGVGEWYVAGQPDPFEPDYMYRIGWRYHRPIHNP